MGKKAEQKEKEADGGIYLMRESGCAFSIDSGEGSVVFSARDANEMRELIALVLPFSEVSKILGSYKLADGKTAKAVLT